MRPEGSGQFKKSTSPGLEPATFRLAALPSVLYEMALMISGLPIYSTHFLIMILNWAGYTEPIGRAAMNSDLEEMWSPFDP
jgi:hypothetical protein